MCFAPMLSIIFVPSLKIILSFVLILVVQNLGLPYKTNRFFYSTLLLPLYKLKVHPTEFSSHLWSEALKYLKKPYPSAKTSGTFVRFSCLIKRIAIFRTQMSCRNDLVLPKFYINGRCFGEQASLNLPALVHCRETCQTRPILL